MKYKMKIKVKYKAFIYVYKPDFDALNTPVKIIKPVFLNNPRLLPAYATIKA